MLIFIWYISFVLIFHQEIPSYFSIYHLYFNSVGYWVYMKMHWPVRMKKDSVGFSPKNLITTDIPGTWRAMETLCDGGKARAIGVGNFSCKKLLNLLEIARIPPAINQVECHPFWQQQQLHEFCKSRGVHLSVSISSLM